MNTTNFRLHDIEFDPETGDFFYLGHLYDTEESHFISRLDYKGDVIWGKKFNDYSVNNTLEYSPTYETLYYLIDANPTILTKIDSTDGANINLHQLESVTIVDNYGDCSLSGDELALF